MRLVVTPRIRRRARGPALALAVLVLALALRAAPVAAEPPALASAALPGAAGPSRLFPLSGLFDPSRLTWNQSLTFGFSSGSFGAGGSSGLYTSSFGYRLADPLRLRVDVGAHLTSGFRGSGSTQGVFLQGMSLDWRPSKNSVIRFEYQDMRSPLQWRSRYYGAPGYLAPGLEPGDGPSLN